MHPIGEVGRFEVDNLSSPPGNWCRSSSKRMRIILAFSLVLVSCGCSEKASTSQSAAEIEFVSELFPGEAAIALRDGMDFQLFSIDDRETDSNMFHGYNVLGSTHVTELEQHRLFESLAKGVEEMGGAIAPCFDPHHGIRVKHSGKIHDFVICFECYQIYWYVDGLKEDSFSVSRSPLDVFNAVIERTSVVLP